MFWFTALMVALLDMQQCLRIPTALLSTHADASTNLVLKERSLHHLMDAARNASVSV